MVGPAQSGEEKPCAPLYHEDRAGRRSLGGGRPRPRSGRTKA